MNSKYFIEPGNKSTRFFRRLPFFNHLVPRWTSPDYVTTPHNIGFSDSQYFADAYDAAVKACGFDYRIPWRVHQAMWAAHQTLKLEGDFVELGTGRGFVMKAVLHSISNWNSLGKNAWLYDLFKSFSVSGKGKQEHEKYYARSIDEVVPTFEGFQRVHLVEGDVLQTLDKELPCKIAFLHVDLNDAATERECIERLWAQVSQGGIILLDDYANRGHEDQYKELNYLFEKLERPVLTVPAGQGIVIK